VTRMPMCLVLCLCGAALALGPSRPTCADAAPREVTVDPMSRLEAARPFLGWGTSLAWWANVVGGWGEERRAELLDLLFDTERGLGLNVVRYNIGGGDQSDHLQFYRPGGAVPGFRPAPDAAYDWEADANQRRVLLEGIARGVTIVEAFSNSPPWWMTKSGSATGKGARGAAEPNLRDDMYGAFADYLTEVVRRYRDEHDVAFDALSPLNEPSADWWGFGGNQEGCHFGVAEQERLLHEVGAKVREKGLGTKIAAPEEFSVEWTLDTWRRYREETRALVGQVSTHTYGGSAEARRELRELADRAGKPISVSEYGSPGFHRDLGPGHWEYPSALELARVITLDLNHLLPVTWVYWQAVEPSDWQHHWGLIHCSYTDEGRPWLIRKQYWAYKHFTRHLRPGSLVLPLPDTSPLLVAAALGPGRRSLVLVVTNPEPEERPLMVDLSGLDDLPAEARWFVTTEGQDYAAREAVPVRERTLTLAVPGRSISTLVLEPVATALIPPP